VRGTRTVRRLLGVVAALALVGPLSNVARPDVAAAAPTGYVTMSDGVSIAVNVRMPTNYVPGLRYPTVFEMSGYDGGSANGGTLAKDVGVPPGTPVPVDDSRQLTDYLNGDYVTVHASVRGTGCSSGEFDLFSWRSALDGKEIIDNWIPNQPWSNGAVGILGHSYGGITGFMVAATQPQHLKAATVSGLIDDLYRGIVYPGGVSNFGFPLIWTGGIRTAYDVGGGLLPGLVRPQRPGDSPNRQEQCALNTAGKSRSVTNDPALQGLSDTDNDWYRSRSLINYVDKIKVPIHIVGAYQDEQTGPRGQTHLFERVSGVPKRLFLSNDTPDTECKHLLADEKQTPTPSRCTSTSSAPSADTASTTRVTPRARHSAPTAPTGFKRPTEVSCWIIATVETSGLAASAAATSAGRGSSPQR